MSGDVREHGVYLFNTSVSLFREATGRSNGFSVLEVNNELPAHREHEYYVK